MMSLSAIMLLLAVTVGSSSAYDYHVSEERLWSNESTTESNVDYVSVRAYVPGSNTINYKTVPIYSSTTTSGANSLGDVVGYTNNIYGTSPAFVDPYDGGKYTLNYPTYQLMKTRMYEVNDQRLTLGDYMQTGAVVTPFVYDLIYKKYTTLSELNSKLDTTWTHMSDMNNLGQVVGTDDEGGFVYDCQDGQSTINVECSTWTKPQKIDDNGIVYGTFYKSGVSETYFMATTGTTDITCSLIRDDVFEPIVFGNGLSFEMSGDSANAISVADFSGDGTPDILADHSDLYVYNGEKVILYLGEEDFDSKIKYYGESFTSLIENEFSDVIVPADVNDVNNDGIDDSIITDNTKTQLSLGKGDGTYYYVPQTLNKVSKFADMNNDGFADTITVNGGFISVQYQQPVLDTAPEPAPEPAPVDTNDIPAISSDAEEVEFEGEIEEINTNNYVIDGKTVWITSDTVLKINDEDPLEIGSPAQVKGMQNPDGEVVGIKVELN